MRKPIILVLLITCGVRVVCSLVVAKSNITFLCFLSLMHVLFLSLLLNLVVPATLSHQILCQRVHSSIDFF